MPFNSILFILFLIVFTLIYYTLRSRFSQSMVLMAGSFLFYMYCCIVNFLYLIVLILFTYFVAKRLKKSRNNLVLFSAILSILFLLVLGKYLSSFFSSYTILNLPEFSYFNLFVVPIGISFYTLQAISLLVDVNSSKYSGETTFLSTSLFLSFFPQSISGPIHRADELIPQFAYYKKFKAENLIIGSKTILWGYFCKLLVADKLALVVSPIFSSVVDYDGASVFIATLLFSIQIYFDFMGYSLIAIGLGTLLGFRLNINFFKPYSTTSIKEFWRRWHITLSKWMRDYIYIPLGGKNQKHNIFIFTAIFITFIASSFWHGLTVNFILWGIVHSILYILEDIISRFIPINRLIVLNFLIKPFAHILFFITISLSWLIFRTENLNDLILSFNSIISFWYWSGCDLNSVFLSPVNSFYLSIVFLAVFINWIGFASHFMAFQSITLTERIIESTMISILLVLLLLFGDIGFQEFLYFKF